MAQYHGFHQQQQQTSTNNVNNRNRTHIYTQEDQTDPEIRKSSHSDQQRATLYKPHLVCTTNGDVAHGGDFVILMRITVILTSTR